MRRISLFIAILALIISVIALFFAPGQAAPAPLVVQYKISGMVEVVNDCDGLQGSIPQVVRVSTDLNGPVTSSSGTDLLNLFPDPADPPNTPRKIGAYSIMVSWVPSAQGAPGSWDMPVVETVGRRRICGWAINCPVGSGLCKNVAQQVPQVAFNAAGTTKDVAVHCNCI